MRIFGYGTSEIARLYGANIKNKNAEKSTGATAQGDTLQISPEAKALSTFKAVLKDIPLVREDLVGNLKTRISRGEYKPDAEKIAAGILGEMYPEDEI
jgi:negative regulator of flagellin synthesis FlgM